jgi:Transposase family tnp2
MALLISGPKQPENDIDVYLAPLLEDLNKLWRDGVRVFDLYLKKHFTLRAIIFYTINDFPAYGNLSGYKNKGFKECSICKENTHSIRLTNCKKNI